MSKSKFTNSCSYTKIDKLCKQQRKAFNKANKTGKQEHKDKNKQIKASAQREIRRAQSNYNEQELVNLDFDILLGTLSSIILLMPSLNLIHHWLTVFCINFC
jgi:hypothetical protein